MAVFIIILLITPWLIGPIIWVVVGRWLIKDMKKNPNAYKDIFD